MGVTPLPTINQPPNLSQNSAAQTVASAEQKQPAEVKPEEVKQVEVKEVTWQDNPQNCNQETQYIEEAAPFNCIDKPQAPAPQAAPAPARVAPSGSCADWIAAAGIGDVANAQELIRRESGCNPNAVNPSSGACGVAQELPCGKSGCSLGDGACQVRWMNSYVANRYGSWANAVAFHNAHNWY